ncbi:MAG: hypothetical protein VYE40_06525 [Myxococcota bacterium]|nr:hypothetical protein [Myxococcota bacterium]
MSADNNNILDVNGDDLVYEGETNAAHLSVFYGSAKFKGPATFNDFVLVGEGGEVVFEGGAEAPFVMCESGGYIDGEVEALLSLDADEYTDEEFERFIGALEAAASAIDLDALIDDIEDDYEENLDSIREDATIEDIVDFLFGLGVPSLVVSHLAETGGLSAFIAALRS